MALRLCRRRLAFRGKLSVEGALLPNADLEVPEDEAAEGIDERLRRRLRSKASSAWAVGEARRVVEVNAWRKRRKRAACGS